MRTSTVGVDFHRIAVFSRSNGRRGSSKTPGKINAAPFDASCSEPAPSAISMLPLRFSKPGRPIAASGVPPAAPGCGAPVTPVKRVFSARLLICGAGPLQARGQAGDSSPDRVPHDRVAQVMRQRQAARDAGQTLEIDSAGLDLGRLRSLLCRTCLPQPDVERRKRQSARGLEGQAAPSSSSKPPTSSAASSIQRRTVTRPCSDASFNGSRSAANRVSTSFSARSATSRAMRASSNDSQLRSAPCACVISNFRPARCAIAAMSA